MARYSAPAGGIVKGWTVRLDPTPGQAARFRRDCGARRFAYNWAVTEIGEAFGRSRETGEHDPEVWSAWSLRKRWNQVKAEAAPWWAECSKEAYSGGIADAVTALRNWYDSRTGKREGPGCGSRGGRRRPATRCAARTRPGRCGWKAPA